MATIIHFVGRDQLMVREDEEEVQEAFERGGGRAIGLTHHRSGNRVFVNPSLITHWAGRGSRSSIERRQSEEMRLPSLR